MTNVTFLGTNGWYDTDTGNTLSIFVETPEEYIILDAGFGLYKARGLIKSAKPIRIFLSHLHLDHLVGLHTLPLFKFPQGIDIYLGRGQEKILRSILRRPFSTPPVFLPSRIRFHDISKKNKFSFGFEFARLRHSVPCFGFRFEIDGAVISYCTDTGICNNLKRLAAGADLLITECSMPAGDKSPNLFHLTPETAARVAKESGAKKLVLCHFDPGKYPSMNERKLAERAARAIFSETIAASDGMVLSIQ